MLIGSYVGTYRQLGTQYQSPTIKHTENQYYPEPCPIAKSDPKNAVHPELKNKKNENMQGGRRNHPTITT
jgi:hypothetical protein